MLLLDHHDVSPETSKGCQPRLVHSSSIIHELSGLAASNAAPPKVLVFMWISSVVKVTVTVALARAGFSFSRHIKEITVCTIIK